MSRLPDGSALAVASERVQALGPLDWGVRVSIGVPGSGKTYGVTRDALDAALSGVPIIVIDTMEEWHSIPPGLVRDDQPRAHADVASAIKSIAEGDRIAIVQPADDRIVAMADDAARWALENKEELRGVVIPEAWLVTPSSGKLPPHIARVTRTARHRNVAMWLDAQRISMMARNVIELARELRLYAAVGDRDLAIVRDIGGDALVEAVETCTLRYSDGEPGWHVTLGLRRGAPYQISR